MLTWYGRFVVSDTAATIASVAWQKCHHDVAPSLLEFKLSWTKGDMDTTTIDLTSQIDKTSPGRFLTGGQAVFPMLAAMHPASLVGLPPNPTMECFKLFSRLQRQQQGGYHRRKKTAPEELKPFQGLMLGIYLLGVLPAWINPASPGWPAMVVKALPAGRPR